LFYLTLSSAISNKLAGHGVFVFAVVDDCFYIMWRGVT
jgi:hypothetical protein